MKKLWALCFAVGLVVAGLSPASAQRSAVAGLSGVDDADVVDGTVPLKGQGQSAAGVRRLTMWIDGDVVGEITPSGVKQQAEVSYDWDTTRYLTSEQISRNREYEVKVRVVSNSGSEDEVTTKVIVDNAPTAPTGLEGTGTATGVSLRWTPNPEPDLRGYRVEHFFGNEYVKARFVEEASFNQKKDPGRYSYRIVAVRHSEVSKKGIRSAPSEEITIAVGASAGAVGGSTARGSAARGRGSRGGMSRGGRVGARGLPSGSALPRLPGASGLPDAPAAMPWGSYEKRLPYKLPKGGVPIQAAPARSVKTSWTVIPPDGLRWLALGLLLLVTAAFSRFLAWRLQPAPEAAKIDA